MDHLGDDDLLALTPSQPAAFGVLYAETRSPVCEVRWTGADGVTGAQQQGSPGCWG